MKTHVEELVETWKAQVAHEPYGNAYTMGVAQALEICIADLKDALLLDEADKAVRKGKS